MRNIIVVGYPKSGCTWLTRLVAEVVGCPVAGFWHSDKKEIAIEGENRISEFRCYKAHHQLSELGVDPNDPDNRVIYILRDPRDVTLSGANHFQFDRFPAIARFFGLLPNGKKLYRHTIYHLLAPESYRINRMTEAVLHGDATVHNWCRISWSAHLRPYQDNSVLMIRYEDLLSTPKEKSVEILNCLGLSRSSDQIDAAVRNQSFEFKKAEFLKSGERGRAKFLRSGTSGRWREKLPEQAKQRFRAALANELAAWGYTA